MLPPNTPPPRCCVQVLLKWLGALLPVMSASPSNLLLVKWLCLCLAKLSDNMPDVATAAVRDGAADLLAGLLTAQLPELRAAAGERLACALVGLLLFVYGGGVGLLLLCMGRKSSGRQQASCLLCCLDGLLVFKLARVGGCCGGQGMSR